MSPLPGSDKILIVDDFESMRVLVKTGLSMVGLNKFVTMPNGIFAKKWLRENTPRLIISDWNMPKMGGLMLLKTVRATKRLKDIPFIMLTVETDREHVEQALKAGADGYLIKPFNFSILTRHVQKFIDISYVQPPLPVRAQVIRQFVKQHIVTSGKQPDQKWEDVPDVEKDWDPIESLDQPADELWESEWHEDDNPAEELIEEISETLADVEAEDDEVSERGFETILVVDDEPTNIDVISGILKKSYRTKVATSGAKALAIIEKSKPDLVLLDIMMPEMDGFEVCKRIKADKDTEEIPVIFVSAKTETVDITGGLKIGAVDYITKPVNPDILKARVETHLGTARARKQLQEQLDAVVENASMREDIENIVKHDLKNPLSAILSNASILMNDKFIGENQKDVIRQIESSSKRMFGMINSSIDLYKIENGTYQLEAKPFKLLVVLSEVVNDMQALAKDHNVKLHFITEVDDTTVIGEEMLCYPVFANLIANAIEASSEGDVVRISISAEANHVITSIHNAAEIPERIKDNFWDKYVTDGKKNGTGLGAYSSRIMTEVQNGSISYASNSMQGTTIQIGLPVS